MYRIQLTMSVVLQHFIQLYISPVSLHSLHWSYTDLVLSRLAGKCLMNGFEAITASESCEGTSMTGTPQIPWESRGDGNRCRGTRRGC